MIAATPAARAALPKEGIDAWNSTRVLSMRGLRPPALLTLFDTAASG